MNDKNYIGYIFSGISFLTGSLCTEEILNIVCAVLSSISLGIAIAYTIWKWWRTAHADGKITKDEIEDLVDDVVPQIEEFKDNIKK